MFAPLSQEADQPPRDRLDIARLIAVEDPQFSARIRGPRVIEIQHERNRSLITPLRLIYVTCVARTGRIPSVVKLEIEQTEIASAIDIESQLLEIAEQRTLFFEQWRSEPAGAIAANIAALLQSMVGADAGAGKIPAIAAAAGAANQLADALVGNEAIAHRDAVAHQSLGGTASSATACDFNVHGVLLQPAAFHELPAAPFL
jgi:hypothetical protein